jgi:hypothetical protein
VSVVDGLTHAISGALAAGYLVAALFFVRFWRRSGVGLFATFAVAFALLAVQRAMLPVAVASPDAMPWSYVLRLIAFVLILAAIVARNRAPRRPGGGPA